MNNLGESALSVALETESLLKSKKAGDTDRLASNDSAQGKFMFSYKFLAHVGVYDLKFVVPLDLVEPMQQKQTNNAFL